MNGISAKTWNYFNGDLNGPADRSGYHPLAYCAACAPARIPGWNNAPHMRGREHWETDFRCAPWRIGRLCDGCSREI